MFMNNKNKNTSEESQNYKSDFYLEVQATYKDKVRSKVATQITGINNNIIDAAQQGQNCVIRTFDSEYMGVVDRLSDYYLKQGFSTTITYLQNEKCRLTIKWEDIDSYE